MTHEFLQSKQEIYEELRDLLTGEITKLTNFTDRSFNFVWTQAFSEEIRELQEFAVIAELSGFIDYVGGPVDEKDLADLGLDEDISAERVNELMDDEYLDQFVKIVGITRDEGSRASGNVTFTTQSSSTTIPEGTLVTTPSDIAGGRRDFLTVHEVSNSAGETEISDVEIQAIEVGEEYNVPADSITRISNPPVGVTGVTNTASTTGGDDPETNDELRERAKGVVRGSSEGGTVEGIETFIISDIEGVEEGNVILDEFFDGDSNTDTAFVDVIVDGGLDTEVEDAIEDSRPAGIRHNLVRPQIIQIGGEINLLGTDIDTDRVKKNVEDFLLELGLDDNLYSDQIIREIMETDQDIINIDLLNANIEKVTNESFTFFDGKSDYRLDFTYEETNGSITIEDEDGNEYTEGNDFRVDDQTGDEYPETIVWIDGSNNPDPSGPATLDDGEDFFVDYDVTVFGETKNGDIYRSTLVRDEIFTFDLGISESIEYLSGKRDYQLTKGDAPFKSSVSISGYLKDYDYQLAPVDQYSTSDTFSFDINTDQYSLSTEVEIDEVGVSDVLGAVYKRGSDYRLINTDADNLDDTLAWDVDAGGAVADDGGTTNDETTAANNDTADDMKLLPSSPATGDAYYFGLDQTFSGLDLNISTAGDGTWSVVWEYYDGSTWDSLSNVFDDTNAFRNGGRNQVLFEEPSAWSTTSVGGISGLYWIRARLDTFSSITTQPLGQEVKMGRNPRFSPDTDGAGVEDSSAGTTTDQTVEANDSTADDMTLLPSSTTAGDAYYFGLRRTFSEFALNISTAGEGDWVIEWEYYDGTGWSSLLNVLDDTNGFRNSGTNSVEFDVPGDWSRTTFSQIENLYLVRARVTSVDSSNTVTLPLGQEVEMGLYNGDTSFTVSYDSYPRTIQWDQSGWGDNPANGTDFSVNYDRRLYETELEIVETPKGEIRDSDGTVYDEGTEYDIVDRTRDKEFDSVLWTQKPGTLNAGEEFYFSYNTEGDVPAGEREKIDPGTINVEVN